MKTRLFSGFAACAATVLLLVSLGSCDLFLPTGTVSGTIRDYTTANGLAGVEVTVVGNSFFSTTTDSSGNFEFQVPIGSQTLHFTLDGYEFPDLDVVVTVGDVLALTDDLAWGQPVLSAGEYRIVLTWGASPYDLDSHLVTPAGQEIYYSNKIGTGVNLDVDDTSSYGPETITITAMQAGTYKYFVHNYSSTPDITTSSAKVQVFDVTGLLMTYNVPTTGTGRYWNVFTLNGSGITGINQVQSTAP